uniref:Uncharacterized protein n=1 Tax=Knipowitschia caucasica TaxID=637954 RepID=A0AAV2L8K9_KNICA
MHHRTSQDRIERRDRLTVLTPLSPLKTQLVFAACLMELSGREDRVPEVRSSPGVAAGRQKGNGQCFFSHLPTGASYRQVFRVTKDDPERDAIMKGPVKQP